MVKSQHFAAAGNGGVWSSVEELALYEHALQQGIFLKKETIRDARTVKQFSNWNSSEPPFIGWSWFIKDYWSDLQSVGHPGSQGGFLTNYITIPDKGILLVVLCNAPREEYEMQDFTNYILAEIEKQNWYD